MSQADTLSPTENLKIVNSEAWEFRGDLEPAEQHYLGNVRMTHDSVFLFCDTAIVTESKMTAIGDVVIIQSDTIELFADSMIYKTNSYEARMFKNVVLQNGPQQLFTDTLDYNLNTKLATFPDTVLMKNEGTIMNSLRGSYDVNADIATFVGNVEVDDEQFNLTSDSLIYNTGANKAIFVSPTNIILEDGESIYCASGEYNMNYGTANFGTNPKYRKDKATATADRMKYDERSGLVTLIGNAHYTEEDTEAKADEIIYNQETKDITLKGNGWINDNGSILTGEFIKYNEETEKMEIDGVAKIDSDDAFISSQQVQKDTETEDVLFIGDAYFESKEDSTRIFAHTLRANEDDKRYIATGDTVRPYMQKPMDGDTLFLSADTLFISEQVDSLDTIQIFKAYQDVRILNKEFQARADSMYYSSKDSVFILYQNPIMWSDSSQFTGDTIKLYLVDDKLKNIELIKNAFIIEWIQSDFYNQIKSKYLIADMDSSTIKKMHMDQNAESNYYILDEEDAYIGLNHTLCRSMDFHFTKGELKDIRFYYEPTSVMTPVLELSAQQKILDGFSWDIKRRPNSLDDLIELNKPIELNLSEDRPLDSMDLEQGMIDSLNMEVIDSLKIEVIDSLNTVIPTLENDEKDSNKETNGSKDDKKGN